MLQVPRFVDIDTVSEKHITEIRDDTGEKIIIPYKDWEKEEKLGSPIIITHPKLR